MNLSTLHNVYFIGVGGIGMSAIARFFNERNVKVSGFDKTPTDLTRQLESEGILIHYSDDVNLLSREAQLVVFTPAIPATHHQLTWYRENNYMVVKRSDVLQMITNQMQAICVAGTHGKTTISTLIAHILKHTGFGCNAFLGGISANYDVNYWSSSNPCAVIEADEYDRSFLKLFPFMGIVTAMDADHLDIYGTVEEMERCYLQFVKQISDTLLFKHGLKHSSLFEAPKMFSYSLQNSAATYYASDIEMKFGTYVFQFNRLDTQVGEIRLNIGGMHNVENAVAALAICDLLKIDFEKTRLAVEDFKGVKRRFEYIIKNEKIVFIDDYAHHPEELKVLLQSAKALFPSRKISVVFQPHLFSRTRDFALDFAESLDKADEVILLDIYPAREIPIEGVTSKLVLDAMSINNKHILQKESVLEWARVAQPEVLITAGAGDIDQLISPLKQIIQNQQA